MSPEPATPVAAGRKVGRGRRYLVLLEQHRPELMVIGAFFLVALAWAVSTPPGASADEPSHYVRMIGMGDGHFIGGDVPPEFAALIDDPTTTADDVRAARLVKEAGRYRVPRSDRYQNPCNTGQPARPFDCPPAPRPADTDYGVSFHARTLPGSYLLPGLLSRLTSGGNQRLYLGRLGFVVQNTFLFGIAVFLLAPLMRRSRGEASLLVLFAMTPLLMFQMGVLSPDGTEAVAILAYTAALLAFAQAPSRRLLWLIAGLCVVAAMTRDVGLVFIPAITVIAIAARPRRYREAIRVARRRDLGAAALAFAGFAGAVVWRMVLQYNTTDLEASPSAVKDALVVTRHAFVSSFGIVGWNDLPHPAITPKLWALTALGLVIVLGWRSWRWVLVAASAAMVYLAVSVYISLTQTAFGFGLQGRYTIALASVGAVLASASFPSARTRSAPPVLRLVGAVAVSAIAAIGYLSVLLHSAQRHANGLNAHPVSFSNVVWQPPFGWTVSLALFAVATLWVAALPLLVARRTPDPQPLPVPATNEATAAP